MSVCDKDVPSDTHDAERTHYGSGNCIAAPPARSTPHSLSADRRTVPATHRARSHAAHFDHSMRDRIPGNVSATFIALHPPGSGLIFASGRHQNTYPCGRWRSRRINGLCLHRRRTAARYFFSLEFRSFEGPASLRGGALIPTTTSTISMYCAFCPNLKSIAAL